MKSKFLYLIISIFFILCACSDDETTVPVQKEDDKSPQIAELIQSKVNTGGYNGCVAKSIGYQVVKVELHFPAGTRRLSVEANTKGVADMLAQSVRFASTIYYYGYSGRQKICEYEYDPYTTMVTKKK